MGFPTPQFGTPLSSDQITLSFPFILLMVLLQAISTYLFPLIAWVGSMLMLLLLVQLPLEKLVQLMSRTSFLGPHYSRLSVVFIRIRTQHFLKVNKVLSDLLNIELFIQI